MSIEVNGNPLKILVGKDLSGETDSWTVCLKYKGRAKFWAMCEEATKDFVETVKEHPRMFINQI